MLLQLQEKYPVALYAYFRVTNSTSAFERYKDGTTKYPFFIHLERLNAQNVEEKLVKIEEDLSKLKRYKKTTSFLQWRKAEYSILQHFCTLRNKKHASEEDVTAYLEAQYNLYGGLDQELFQSILAYIKSRAVESERLTDWEKVSKRVNIRPTAHTLPEPDEKTFNYYKQMFVEGFPELFAVLDSIDNKNEYVSKGIKQIFELALQSIEADKAGWSVIRTSGGSSIIVSKFRSKIKLPRSFRTTSALRLRQIIAHEVGGHVQRSLIDKEEHEYNGYDDTEEGLAILLEQLVDDHFVHKRAMRYFAICLSIGADGKRRDFNEVYDILRLTYRILGYGPVSSKQAAFNETTRAFRGGLPEVPGAVYIKDKIYLEGNINAWKNLQAKQLSVKEFRQLFTGRGNIPKEA